jgi:ADP-ribosyl-[dinitrogen reductase] hydrolase
MSACVVAAMAAWAIEQHPMDAVVAAGLGEADHLAGRYALPPAALEPIRQAASGEWVAEAGGPSDAVGTLASVLHVLRGATEPAAAMKDAVALGGDTDTAAAIVGGILGCQREDVESEISWLSHVRLPRADELEATATGLYELRRSL